jgi:hypothetical protein
MVIWNNVRNVKCGWMLEKVVVVYVHLPFIDINKYRIFPGSMWGAGCSVKKRSGMFHKTSWNNKFRQ